MKPINTAVKLREFLGCYNIMLHKPPPVPKRKTVKYSAMLKAHFDMGRFARSV